MSERERLIKRPINSIFCFRNKLYKVISVPLGNHCTCCNIPLIDRSLCEAHNPNVSRYLGACGTDYIVGDIKEKGLVRVAVFKKI